MIRIENRDKASGLAWLIALFLVALSLFTTQKKSSLINAGDSDSPPTTVGNKASTQKGSLINLVVLITALITAIASLATALTTYWLVDQSKQTISIAKDGFYLSVSPSINVSFQSQAGRENLLIQNTSQYALENIEVYSINYEFSTEPRMFISRNQRRGSHFAYDAIPVGSEIAIPLGSLTFDIDQTSKSESTNEERRIRSAVIIFHRAIDKKRFVRIEPYIAYKNGESIVAMSLYASSSSGVRGDPSLNVFYIKSIIDTEKVLFRADSD